METFMDFMAAGLMVAGLITIVILALLLRDARRAIVQAQRAAQEASASLEAIERRLDTSAQAFEQTCTDIGDTADTVSWASVVLTVAAGALGIWWVS